MIDEKNLLTLAEAAAELDVHKTLLQKRLGTTLQGIQLGGRWFVTREALEAYKQTRPKMGRPRKQEEAAA